MDDAELMKIEHAGHTVEPCCEEEIVLAEQARLRAEVEGKRHEAVGSGVSSLLSTGYNTAIDDILSLLPPKD